MCDVHEEEYAEYLLWKERAAVPATSPPRVRDRSGSVPEPVVAAAEAEVPA